MRLTKWDRDVARIWIEAGEIPDGHTERETALRIIGKAMDDIDELTTVIVQKRRADQQWTKRDAYQGQFAVSAGGSFDNATRES